MSHTLVERMCDAVRIGEKMDLEDLNAFIDGVARRTLPVELIEAWLKCVHSHGISVEETTALTSGMMNSGAVLSWQDDPNVCDKHSTGGVGDKMSLILAPALAANLLISGIPGILKSLFLSSGLITALHVGHDVFKSQCCDRHPK